MTIAGTSITFLGPERHPVDTQGAREAPGRHQNSVGGGPEPGNLAQDPLEPKIHRMSNILLRKEAILHGGSGAWKSSPRAARAENPPDEQYSFRKEAILEGVQNLEI